MSWQITPIPAGTEHSWTMETRPGFFRASSPRFGTLSFGLRPEGPQAIGWAWEEVGGGGSNVVPHCVIDGRLFIGMIHEQRPMLPGGYGWNIPRGFLEPGKTHVEAARQEWEEEVGSSSERLLPLPGKPYNPNSTFFDTSGGGGSRFFEFAVLADEVEPVPNEPLYQFVVGHFRTSSKMGEKIVACRFFPWQSAAESEDGVTASGLARLIVGHPELREFLK